VRLPVSKAKKTARNKWDKENMTVLGCKVKVEEAERFKAATKARGTNPNAVFKACMEQYLEKYDPLPNQEDPE